MGTGRWVKGEYPLVLGYYSWLCVQGSLLVVLVEPTGCQRPNLELSKLLTYGPMFPSLRLFFLNVLPTLLPALSWTAIKITTRWQQKAIKECGCRKLSKRKLSSCHWTGSTFISEVQGFFPASPHGWSKAELVIHHYSYLSTPHMTPSQFTTLLPLSYPNVRIFDKEWVDGYGNYYAEWNVSVGEG